MPDNKNHHFVPQFYLRHFGAGHRISLYHILTRKHVPVASIPNQCQRPYLYGKDQILENWLKVVEGDASRVLKSVMETGRIATDAEPYCQLIRFLVYQWGRTPSAGEAQEEMVTKLFRGILRAHPDLPNEARSEIDSVRVTHRASAQYSLMMARSLGHCLLDLKCVLLTNASKLQFITSDAPVVMWNQWCAGVTNRGTTGLASSGLQVLLPISPSHALVLFDDTRYQLRGGVRSPVALEEQDVRELNKLQLLVAENCILYSGDSYTKQALDELAPLVVRRKDKVGAARAIDDAGGSQLLHLYTRGYEHELNISFLRIRKGASHVPIAERGNSYRPQALVADRFHRPQRERSAPPAGSHGPWKVVESD